MGIDLTEVNNFQIYIPILTYPTPYIIWPIIWNLESRYRSYSIEEYTNIHDNVGDRIVPITYYYSKYITHLYYIKLMKIKYVITNIVECVINSYEYLIEEYYSLTQSQLDEVFITACNNNILTIIRYLISQGYQVNVESLTWKIIPPHTTDNITLKPLSDYVAILLLEILPLDNEKRYQIWKERLLSSKSHSYLHFFHPVVYPLWRRYRQDNIDRLSVPSEYYCDDNDIIGSYYQGEVRDINRLGFSIPNSNSRYDVLVTLRDVIPQDQRIELFNRIFHADQYMRYVTDPRFSDIWLLSNVIDNEEFMWFLYHNRIELPETDRDKSTIIQYLLMENDHLKVVKRLTEPGRDKLLLKFLYYSGVDISSLRGCYPALDKIIERLPIHNVKSATKK